MNYRQEGASSHLGKGLVTDVDATTGIEHVGNVITAASDSAGAGLTIRAKGTGSLTLGATTNAAVTSLAPLGYGTGAGGAVTQITSAATAVTLNKASGQITTVALTTAAGAEEQFTVNNSFVAATDVIVLSTTYAGAGQPMLSVIKVGAGVFDIVITNVSAAALNALMVINFAVIKAVNA